MKESIFSLKTAKTLIVLIQVTIFIPFIWLPSLAWSDTGTWAPVNPPSGSSIRQILVDPNDTNTIYAVSLQGGLFVSNDRAENWHRVYDQFYDTSKYSDSASFDAGYGNYPSNIALENVNGKTIIYRPSVNYSNIKGLRQSEFKSIISSIDAGVSWQSLSRPNVKLTAANDSFDCIDLYITQASYICGYYGKLFRSTDLITNQWERVEPLKEFPLPGKKSFLFGEVEHAITIAADNPSTIYALGRKDDYTDTSIYKSINAGINWTTVSNKGIGKSAAIYGISTNQFTGALYAIGIKGFFRSLDQGKSWRLLMKKDKKKQLRTITGLNNNDNIILVGTDVGIYRTLDIGKSWQQTTQAVGSVNGFAVDPVNTQTIYAATDTGVFISSDAGNTWQLKNNGFYRDVNPNLIADSANPGTWIVSSTVNYYRYPLNQAKNITTQLSYFVTYDYGMHWQTIFPDRGGTFPVNKERYGIGAVTINKKSVSGLIKTVDNGLTWKLVLPVKKSEKNEYFFNPNKTSEIYVKTTEKLTSTLKVVEVDEFANKTYQRTAPYTHYAVTIKKTIDGGETWSDIRVFRSSIKKNNDDTVLIREVMMTVDPSDFNRTLIGINYGWPYYDSNFKSASIVTNELQITGDGGLNWRPFRQKSSASQGVKRIVLDKLSYGISVTLDNYDSTPRYRHYFVSNDLATWTEQKAALLPRPGEIKSPLHSNIIFAPFGGFITSTTDNRQTWLKLTDGLPLGRATDGLVIDKLAQPSRLFTGSRGQIYQLLLQ